MERLTQEQLARLVDEAPTPEEQALLDADPALRAELEALKAQTRALADLPKVMPPQGEWASLETALVEQGLIQTPKRGFVVSPTWIRLAAGLLLFIGGTAFGSAFDGAGMPMSASQDGVDAQNTFASVDDAAAAVRQAERQWMAAMGEYRRLSEEGGLRRAPRDPASRFAAIEALLAASQAAIQESPADPFFNGVLVSTLAERDRALRQIRSSNGDNWY